MKAEYEGVLRLLVLFSSRFGAQFWNISRLKRGSADKKWGRDRRSARAEPVAAPRDGAKRRPLDSVEKISNGALAWPLNLIGQVMPVPGRTTAAVILGRCATITASP